MPHKDPEVRREYARLAKQRRRSAHRETLNTQARIRRVQNLEASRANERLQKQAYRKAHPEKQAVYDRRYVEKHLQDVRYKTVTKSRHNKRNIGKKP
jgi:hypothetical protein